jgi:hypothetical protein
MNWLEVQAARPDLTATFENHTIRTVVVTRWSSEDLLLSLFLRLNTGSVTLSPQELRQALHPGGFSDWLDLRSGESAGLRRLLNLSAPDRRMVDAELLLRHIAFRLAPIPYRSNLKRFLDDSSGDFNRGWPQWQARIDSALRDMEEAISTGLDVFGDDEFCRRWNQDHYERPFNRALFDVQVAAFSDSSVRAASRTNGALLVEAFQELSSSDKGFNESITLTTKTGAAFRIRFEAWQRAVKRVLGVSFDLPEPLYMPESS